MSEFIARKFHKAYERLAPEYGYETREETRRFDPDSPNGRLMIAVCAEVTGDLTTRLVAAEAALDQAEQASKLLKEVSKVMKADGLHRGNPNLRDLWERISKFRKAIDAARGVSDG